MKGPDRPSPNEGTVRLRLLGEEGGVLLARCEGAIDLAGFRSDDNPLARVLGPDVFSRKVLLDMGQATYLDTTAVSWLISSHKRFRRAGGRLVLHSLAAPVASVLGLLQLDRILDIAPDLPAARAAVREPA
jgi:anti-anti-sigma factor